MRLKVTFISFFSIGLFGCGAGTNKNVFSAANWKYICIDSTRTSMRDDKENGAWFFGLDIGDIDADGYPDVASGKWIYLNLKANANNNWNRITVKNQLDILLCMDVDGDAYTDIIALKCNEQYWLELTPGKLDSLQTRIIGNAPICNHDISSQGYLRADILLGGREEFILTDKPGRIICYQIPDNPNGIWPYITITETGASEKGIAAMDMDFDGDLDIIASKKSDDWSICWFENPGTFVGNWKYREIGDIAFVANNIITRDINGDDHIDIVVSEGRWPGEKPDASIYWFENPGFNQPSILWKRNKIASQYSTNSLSAADMDSDGDIDLVTAEHKGPNKELQIWENNGKGDFIEHLIDQGKENHLGARLVDIDKDGDLDLVGIGWTDYKYLHLWENISSKE